MTGQFVPTYNVVIMVTIDEIFGVWGSVADMATDIGVSTWRVGKWKQRKRIPSDHWPAVIAALERKGEHLGGDDLLRLHSNLPTTGSEPRAS